MNLPAVAIINFCSSSFVEVLCFSGNLYFFYALKQGMRSNVLKKNGYPIPRRRKIGFRGDMGYEGLDLVPDL